MRSCRGFAGAFLASAIAEAGRIVTNQFLESLRQQSQPTFVTINERDFWRKVAIDEHFCIVCFALPDPRGREIASSFRTLLQHPEFNTKAKRMGKVLRVTDTKVAYYCVASREILEIVL